MPDAAARPTRNWLKAQPEGFRPGIKVATLAPFRGYANAIDEQLPDAVTFLDAFHVVKLGPP
ncbi:transposase [Paeniglutamicibacter psychrophenolicus]|uniref:transposase n=1 Tax=Paeniglutamicibacter psychrophenolicus TaxID=257454 RepID=UPI001AE8FF4A